MNFIVISIRKYFFTIFFLLFIICLLLFSNNNLIAAQNGLVLWATKVLPSLFPFFVATELLCQTNFTYILGKLLNKFMKPIFNVPGESATAIILGTISGYPVGAKVVCNLKKQKIISKIEAERLIAYTNNSGPLFILGTVGISLFGNSMVGFLLLLTHILACLSVGILFRFWKYHPSIYNSNLGKQNSQKKEQVNFSNLGDILGKSIFSSIKTVVMIGGFVVLFSVILSILKSSHVISIVTHFLSPFLRVFGIQEIRIFYFFGMWYVRTYQWSYAGCCYSI